jgi:hypothetical protein
MVNVLTMDESTTGARLAGPTLTFENPTLTIRELIERRVLTEVEIYNLSRPDAFYGLVQPSDIEQFLNGPRKRSFKPLNAKTQVDVAIDAFQRQRFLVLLPKGQASSLDQKVTFQDRDEISFLKLIPLIGG